MNRKLRQIEEYEDYKRRKFLKDFQVVVWICFGVILVLGFALAIYKNPLLSLVTFLKFKDFGFFKFFEGR